MPFDSEAQTAGATTPGRARLDAVDLVRGLVMVLMLLDHTRDFVHESAFAFDATDVTRTTPVLFLTRWVTHFCAPVFVFLAGASVMFQRDRGKTPRELSRFLVTRGLWLIVLELTLVRIGGTFELDLAVIGPFQVIWVIGVSMLVMAVLVHLPTALVGALGLAVIAGHNLFDGIHVDAFPGPDAPSTEPSELLVIVLHQPGVVVLGATRFLVLYPLVPWPAVMAVGYAFAAIYRHDRPRRAAILVQLGLAVCAAFVVLRAVNGYGDPSPWSPQSDATFTVLSFLATTKYPASLAFLTMTLGPAIVLLGLLERRTLAGPIARALVTFGRVPLFFYLLQWPLAHAMGLVLSALAGRPTAPYLMSLYELFMLRPSDFRFPLWVVFTSWIVGIAILYPLCRWFADVKRRRRDWWLSYL